MGVIEAVELYRFYHSGDAEVIGLRGVNLSLSEGELVALLGPSGSGKSTFLHLLAGLDEPDGGHVDVQGIRLSRRSETVRAAIRARHIGMYMQSGNLFDHLSVVENIRLQRRLAGKTSDDESTMNLVNRLGLATHWNALPAELSEGEAARAGSAERATAEVDAETERQIISDLDERRRAGTAILIATHSPVLASAADRVLKLQDGRLVREPGK